MTGFCHGRWLTFILAFVSSRLAFIFYMMAARRLKSAMIMSLGFQSDNAQFDKFDDPIQSHF
jgi:hypothetical protein